MTVTRPFKEENPRRCQEPSVEIVVLIIPSFLPGLSSSAAFFHIYFCGFYIRWYHIIILDIRNFFDVNGGEMFIYPHDVFNVGYRMFFHDRARGEAECDKIDRWITL